MEPISKKDRGPTGPGQPDNHTYYICSIHPNHNSLNISLSLPLPAHAPPLLVHAPTLPSPTAPPLLPWLPLPSPPPDQGTRQHGRTTARRRTYSDHDLAVTASSSTASTSLPSCLGWRRCWPARGDPRMQVDPYDVARACHGGGT